MTLLVMLLAAGAVLIVLQLVRAAAILRRGVRMAWASVLLAPSTALLAAALVAWPSLSEWAGSWTWPLVALSVVGALLGLQSMLRLAIR